jgi:NTP pyrophosphatase (non-canonical NTP hydrolase)
MLYEELQQKVIEWANEKGILEKSNPVKQLTKTQEELDETMEALRRLAALDFQEVFKEINDPESEKTSALFEAKDGIGDMLVTIIILAEMIGFNSIDCLQTAYDVIKGRTGKMVDGLFVKDS